MEPDRRIRRIAIVGGGMAGWLGAISLSRRLAGQCSIHVVDVPESGIAGLAESTIPPLLELLKFLGIDQNDFIDKTQSTYSLGARLTDWSAQGQSFWRPFGAFGALIERRPFYHFWHKAKAAGLNPRPEFFSQEIALAQSGRFIFPTNSLGVAQQLRYSLNIDAGLASRYLRSVAERSGVIRLERKLVGATRREDGFIDELQFEDGGKLRADLYIDNTGPRGQLIGETLGVGFESWQQWLPCDRILSAPASLEESRPPYVRIAARAAGWQWRTSLQQTLSVGHVYSSAYQDDESALAELRAAAGSELREPRRFEFTSGRRRSFWDKNVVALGSASACLEPLVAADLHLVTNALFNLLDHFPDRQFDPANIASYNASLGGELERIRDYILLHYCLAGREDSPFWQQFAKLELPEILARRIGQYRATGRIVTGRDDLFSDLDLFWIFEGMGVTPRDYDPLVDSIDFEQVKRVMLAIHQKIGADANAAPTHDSFFPAANARLGNARKTAAAASPAG